jgi:hypothetical protein
LVGHPAHGHGGVDGGVAAGDGQPMVRSRLLPSPIQSRATAVHSGRFWSFAGRPRRNG